METSLWLQPQLNAIVFEHRNKAYGAFELRSEYHRIMSRSILISISLFILAFLGLCLYQEYVSSRALLDKIFEVEKVVILDPVYQVEKPKVKPIPKLSHQAINSQPAVTPTKVVIDQQVIEPVAPSDPVDFQSVIVGHGDDNAPIENPVDSSTGDGSVDGDVDVEVVAAPIPSYLVDQQPEFPGGKEAMYKYLRDHLSFPEMAKEINLSGTVVMQFMVSATGQIEKVIIVKSPSSLFNRTSLEAIKGMPNWKPGIYHGKPVPVIFTLPLKFELM